MFDEKIKLIKKCIAILHKAQKPSKSELMKIGKISALLMIVTGSLGLIIALVLSLV